MTIIQLSWYPSLLLHQIVTKQLGYQKVCVHWVPKMLTCDHKKQRKECSEAFLNQPHEKSHGLSDHIVT